MLVLIDRKISPSKQTNKQNPKIFDSADFYFNPELNRRLGKKTRVCNYRTGIPLKFSPDRRPFSVIQAYQVLASACYSSTISLHS